MESLRICARKTNRGGSTSGIFEVNPQRIDSRGFTMVEMLVVVGLIAIITALGLAMSMDSFRGFSFRNDRDAVVAALQRARARAVNNICLGTGCTDGKTHGVYFDPATSTHAIVVFQGNSYNSGDPTNEIVKFESSATRIVDFPPGNVIVFEQLSGNSALATVGIADESGRNATTTVNAVGRIDY